MKVLLIANYLPDRQQSMLHIVNMLCRELRNKGQEVKIIRAQPFFNFFKSSTKGLGKWLGYIDKFIIFPFSLKKELSWADIVHICDHSNSIYTKYLKNKPNVITCCDLLAVRSALGEFKDNPTRWTGKVLQRMILKGLNRAKSVVCISEATKLDLLRLSSLKEENIAVIYLGFNYDYEPMERVEVQERLKSLGFDISNPFILHVGKNNWYKNRKGLISIFKHIANIKGFENYKLVLAGEPLSKDLLKFIDKMKVKDKIFELILPKDEDLKALYSMTEALLYPSIAEGFGWPIAEAQACGCMVFTTNRAPMTEAGAEAAVYFNPDNHEETARIVTDTLKDSKRVEEIRQKGFENAKRFDSKKMIDEYIKIYRKAIEKLN